MPRAKGSTKSTGTAGKTEAANPDIPAGMTELVANRDFTLQTRDGHTIRFKEDVPKNVPNALVPQAMQFGAMPTDRSKLEKPSKETATPAPQGGDRQTAIQRALNEIVERNDRNDFGANSRPKVEAVSKVAGFEVHEKEMHAIWETMGR